MFLQIREQASIFGEKEEKNQGNNVTSNRWLIDDGLWILQYADDTVIFLDHDIELAKNIKLLLCVFE